VRAQEWIQGNIPADITSFVGRGNEVAEVEAALSHSRLVTLTGVGGVGKSRVAKRVAQGGERAFSAGAWVADLSTAREPSLLMATVASALGLASFTGEPTATVIEYLADKELLLVLDGCEHLVSRVAELVRTLLEAAEGLRIVVTSRKRLRVRDEHVVEIAPLPIQDGSEGGKDSVSLFAERAAAVVPGFTLDDTNRAVVARLCQRLDGLPLAIELAAVWMRVLPLEQILERLERLPDLFSAKRLAWSSPRHQTMQSTVDWSYQLCAEREQRVWRRVSVFAAGFEPDAAETVCSDETLPQPEVRASLAELVLNSVLIRERSQSGVRYRLLETIRDYGRQRLRESGEQMVLLRRHRDYYLRFAEQGDEDWFGPRQLSWLRRSRLEHANLRAALNFCVSTSGAETFGMKLASALWWHWLGQGLVFEGAHWLDRMLERDTRPRPDRIRALWVRGWIAQLQGDQKKTLTLMDECCALARQFGDEQALAYAKQFSGYSLATQGDVQRGVRLLEEAVKYFQDSGTVNSVALLGSSLLGLMRVVEGEVDRAAELLEDCRRLSEECGERWVLSWTLSMLAKVRWSQGDLRQAALAVRRGLRIELDFDDRLGIPVNLETLAWIHAAEGEPRRAALLLGAISPMWDRIGLPIHGSSKLMGWHENCVRRTHEALNDWEFDALQQEGMRLSVESAVREALRKSSSSASTRYGPLTKRENEIANLVAQGLSNRDIAEKLVISTRTVDSHLEHIYGKLGVGSREKLAAWVHV
jgi:non-specific serine/threonine protein kinase